MANEKLKKVCKKKQKNGSTYPDTGSCRKVPNTDAAGAGTLLCASVPWRSFGLSFDFYIQAATRCPSSPFAFTKTLISLLPFLLEHV